jgi:hypothetical protein
LSPAIIRAPKAPTPAASVGVAMPAIIDPRTTKIKAAGGSRVFKILASPSISSIGHKFLFSINKDGVN